MTRSPTAPAALRPPAPHAPTTSAAVYQRLRDMIVRGRLAPGTPVTEVDVAERLGTSRTPAREALRRLVSDGLLVATNEATKGKVRLAVTPMTPRDVEELYHAAGALEGLVAREVGILSAAGRRALAAEVQVAEDRFEAAATRRQRDWDRLFQTHDAFHRAFVEPLAGPRLMALLAVLRPQLDRYEYLYAPLLGRGFEETFEEHAAIIGALRSGDADGAESAVRENWFRGAARLALALERQAP